VTVSSQPAVDSTSPTSSDPSTTVALGQPTKDTLLALVQGPSKVLNASNTDITEEYMLCYDVFPPYYEALVYPANLSTPSESHD
ncbi:hypothetical protein HispidOSU_017759, partial [Sigmodon hispidus]